MAEKMQSWVALFRAIGAKTHKNMSMQQLRGAADAAGLIAPRTVLATGNLIFESGEPVPELEAKLAGILLVHGLDLDVFLRRPGELAAAIAANPFAEAARERPNHLLVVFHAKPVDPGAAESLHARPGPERVAASGRELYVDYAEGVGTSKLTPNVIARQLGQPGTARNWNTLHKLIPQG